MGKMMSPDVLGATFGPDLQEASCETEFWRDFEQAWSRNGQCVYSGQTSIGNVSPPSFKIDWGEASRESPVHIIDATTWPPRQLVQSWIKL